MVKYPHGQLERIERADRTYEAFMKADPCRKDYFSLVARTHRILEHDISHVRQYDVKAKDFTPESKELARKW